MTDLDRLAALLAAALATLDEGRPVEIRPYRGDATDPDLPLHHYEVAKKLIASIPELPSLIEAARREAAAIELLGALVELEDGPVGSCALCGLDSGHMADCLVEEARSLLHDNAGTATGDEVGEP